MSCVCMHSSGAGFNKCVLINREFGKEIHSILPISYFQFCFHVAVLVTYCFLQGYSS